MDDQHEFPKALQRLEQDLHRLETEYGKFFSHRRTRPPQDLRARVEAGLRRWSASRAPSSADRFRLSTLQERYATYVRLWDGALRAREEGRPGPFSHVPPDPPPGSRHVTAAERRGTATSHKSARDAGQVKEDE